MYLHLVLSFGGKIIIAHFRFPLWLGESMHHNITSPNSNSDECSVRNHEIHAPQGGVRRFVLHENISNTSGVPTETYNPLNWGGKCCLNRLQAQYFRFVWYLRRSIGLSRVNDSWSTWGLIFGMYLPESWICLNQAWTLLGSKKWFTDHQGLDDNFNHYTLKIVKWIIREPSPGRGTLSATRTQFLSFRSINR